MAVDIWVVTVAAPDFEVCDRLTALALGRFSSGIDLSMVDVGEMAPEVHEYAGEHLAILTADLRTTETYLGTYVMAAAAAALYLGRLVDHTGMFPTGDPRRVLATCFDNQYQTPAQLWDALHGSARDD